MASSKPLPRMSGSEVLGCVELVVAAFKEGAELVGRLSRKHKKRKGERNYHELLLFQVLDQGAKQVQGSYDESFRRYGSEYRIGDDETRERLLCVAIETNAGIVNPLQFACDAENATVDLVQLHESAITSRHDAVRTLNDLHQRLEKLRPLGSFSRFSPDSSVYGEDTRRNSLMLNTTDMHSAGRSVPGNAPIVPERSGLRRMLSAGGSTTQHRRIRSDEPHALRSCSLRTDGQELHLAYGRSTNSSSALQPAPLYFNDRPAYPLATESAPRSVPPPMVTHVRSQSLISTSTKPTVKAGTTEWEATKRHPDLPDFDFLKRQKEKKKTANHTRGHSNASSQPSERDSTFSHRNSWDRQSSTPSFAPFTYPVVLPTPPSPPSQRPESALPLRATGVISTALITTLPPLPHHSQHLSVSRAPITSPIPEDPLDVESASVTSCDYDAESVYSQHDEPIAASPVSYAPDTPATEFTSPSSPCTPMTENEINPRSSIRSSQSSAPTSMTAPSSTAPSMHRCNTTAATSSRSRASTTPSSMDRQMIRNEDGTWQDLPRTPTMEDEQGIRMKEKAERLYRPLRGASVGSSAPMGLHLGLPTGHTRCRTEGSVDTTGLGLTTVVSSSAFSMESHDEQKKGRKFWRFGKREAIGEADKQIAKEKERERRARLKEREKRIDWSAMAFAV